MAEPWVEGQEEWIEGAWVDAGEAIAQPPPVIEALALPSSGRRYVEWLKGQPIAGEEEERRRRIAWAFKQAELIEIDDLEILEVL